MREVGSAGFASGRDGQLSLPAGERWSSCVCSLTPPPTRPLLTVHAGNASREAPRAVGAVYRPVPLTLLKGHFCA